jgi:serine protease AprX
MKTPPKRLELHLLAMAMLAALASDPVRADALLDPALLQRLSTALPIERLEIVIVYDQSDAPRGTQLQVLRHLGIVRGLSFRHLPVAGALATPAQIRALGQRSDVRSIYSNRQLRYYNHDARRLSGVDLVQSDQDLGYTGAGVTVMVNDSGIDATHADLSYGSTVVQNVQALTNLSSLVGLLPPTYLENQLNSDIGSGHGTHCAGSVGGSGAQSDGFHRGVATDADIVGYGSGAVISILDAVGGFDYAIERRNDFASPIRVISNSWGSSGTFDPADPVNVASYAAYKHGIVSVFAAGNDGPDANTHNPYAQAPWVISVGAGNKDGTLADFSSRGNPGEGGSFVMPDGESWSWSNQPTLVATGVDVVSTRAITGVLPVLGLPQDAALGAQAIFYTHMSGTSMATPHVAGIVALLLQADPTLTPAEVKEILSTTADPMPHPPHEVGAGHVDAYEAVSVAGGT